ncbi:MAG: hypothetical protein AB8F74_02385 [Saprospiraceae bacterium]
MHLHRNKFLVFIFALFVLNGLKSQTYKGLWSPGGAFEFQQLYSAGTVGNTLLIAPKLGYSFTDRWMVEGGISISLIDKLSIVGHNLNLRYALIKREKLEGYVGLEYRQDERRFLVNGNSGKRSTLQFIPFMGYLYFLHPNIALDVALHYPAFQRYSFSGGSTETSGNMFLELGFNFYFNSKLQKDTLRQEKRLQKGSWMIGGSMIIGGGNSLFFTNRAVLKNTLAPYAALMISKRWMLGSRLRYANSSDLQEFYLGLSPFGRFYMINKTKRSIYAEANIGIEYRYLKENGNLNGLSLSKRSGGLGVGISRWILPNIALDFYLGGDWREGKIRFSNDLISQQVTVLRFGMEAFF